MAHPDTDSSGSKKSRQRRKTSARRRLRPPDTKSSGSKKSRQRRKTSARRRLRPPAEESPGLWWANHAEDDRVTPLEALRQQIAEFQNGEDGPQQVALELLDEGERSPWGGAVDLPEWHLEPWGAVVWIGSPSDAEKVVERVLADSAVGKALCDGAKLSIVDCGGAMTLKTQRENAAKIQKRLASPPPSGAPIADQAIYDATRAAHAGAAAEVAADERQTGSGHAVPQERLASPLPSKVPTGKQAVDHTTCAEQADAAASKAQTGSEPPQALWPPDGGWHFRPGEFAFAHVKGRITGLNGKALKAMADAKGPVTKVQLLNLVWRDRSISDKTLRSCLTRIRNVLRSVFRLDKSVDPIPHVDQGDYLAWKLEESLLVKSKDSQ